MKISFLDLKAQYQQIKEEVQPVVTHAMENGAFVGGEQVTGFEKEFAAYCDTRYCIGVSSGTDALRFALLAAGVGPGHEVITVPNTFIATTEAISQAGATPVFVDVNPHTYNMDAARLEAQITKNTKAIIPVHLYGQPADMDPILDVARRYHLAVIEDACQAHGALYKNRRAGSMGTVGCFSFYPGKNLGAYGEGGAVVTQDPETAQKIKMLRDHGQQRKYVHQIEGYNGRLDAIQAGILRIKLKHLDAWNAARRQNAAHYNKRLSDVPQITLPTEADSMQSVYHLYVILVPDRDRLQRFLAEKGIATGLHYPVPLHLQKAYDHLGYQKGAFAVTEGTAARLLSLPMYPELTSQQIDYIADAIREFILHL